MAQTANTNTKPFLAEGVNTYFTFGDLVITVDSIIGATASGTNTYAITTGKTLTAYYTNQAFFVLFTNGNTASSTLNVDSIGAKTLKKSGSTNLSSGDIAAGQLLLCVYDGTNFQVIGIGGSGGGSGDVVGPASATNGAIVLFDGTTGKLIKNSAYNPSSFDAAGAAAAAQAASQPVDSDLTAIAALSTTAYGRALLTLANAAAADWKAKATGNAYKFETTDSGGNLQETTVTASRAVVTDANGLPTASATTATEIGYVNGVTSAIQTQLDAKAPLASPALTGTPTAPTAAVDTNTTQIATTAFVQTQIAPDVVARKLFMNQYY